MSKFIECKHNLHGAGRPQIILIGNGLEYDSGQVSWARLLDNLTVSNGIAMSEYEKKNVPFPLLYETIILHNPIPSVLGVEDIKKIQSRLKREMYDLKNDSNNLLDCLPNLEADHILTTNYSYCLEKAFFPEKDFRLPITRTKNRFNLLPANKKGRFPNEKYRLHSGYLAYKKDGKTVALWHIHGECHVPSGIVIGHDRYGRLLSRIIDCCSKINYKTTSKESGLHAFKSWPELFLFGDIYIIGFGYAQCEFDLWWLLRRKQRERYGDGKVYFYDKKMDMTMNSQGAFEKRLRDKLLLAHGVIVLDCGTTAETSYDEFYLRVFDDVKIRMKQARECERCN